MKRASYRDAIDFIAFNDEPAELNADIVEGLASVVLIASIFDVECSKVSKDVITLREKSI